MSKAIHDVIENTKEIFMTDSSLNTLLDFERVLDELDTYVFAHWKEGELVEGPIYEKYFVTCTFMWPYKLMPDPAGAKRLVSIGCKLKFKKTKIKVPIAVKNYDDYIAGTRYPKSKEKEIWLILIEMPKELMDDIREGSIDLAGQSIDLDEIDDAYDESLDQEGTKTQDDEGNQQMPQPGMPPGGPMPGAGMPPGPGGPMPGVPM